MALFSYTAPEKNGLVVGVLNLYSTKVEAFSEETKTLLYKMVSNLNHALENIDNNIARSKAEEALSESYNLLNSIINSLPTRIFWKDKNLTYMGCNTVFANDAGKESPQEMIGKNDHEMTWKDQADIYNADDKNVMESGVAKLFFEEPQTTPDGETIWLRTSKVPLKNAHNEVIGILGIYDDITKQKNIENELRKSKQQLNTIIENEPECVKLIDLKGNLLNMNPAGLAMLEAASLEEAKQKSLDEYLLPQWHAPFQKLHQKVMQGESGTLEFEIEGLQGTKKWLETHAVPMYDENNNVYALLGLTRDISDKKLSQERIVFMANYDPLTELPNRANLEEKLEYIISLSKRNNWNFALMFLDLDNFKDINDTLGHNIGDKLLIELGKKLRDNLRAEDTLARLGGDEFIILLPNTDPNEAKEVAQKILGIVYEPISIGDNQLTVSVSIGISIFPNDGTDKETLYKNADAAMYNAKSSGKNNFYFFTKEMHKTSKRNLALSNALHNAIANDQLYLTYQPQVCSTTGKLLGVEALIRWTHPEFGNISPIEFIPLAENNGLILSIGEWVMKTALQQMSQWHSSGLESIFISVNLSAVQFNQSNLATKIETILEELNFPAQYLELELTENVIMTNTQSTIKVMKELQKLGVSIVIDDFGTGYSSLSYLKKFQIQKLKIDKSFIDDITTDPEDQAIVSAIINIADSLGLKKIAEGVETIEQLTYLRENGCQEIQGYYYDKPLTAQEFEEKYLIQKK